MRHAVRPGPRRLSPRLGVADDALDGRESAGAAALERVHQIVHRADRKRRIDAAVKIDDLAVGGLAHAHVVHFAERRRISRQATAAPRGLRRCVPARRRGRRGRRPAAARYGSRLRPPGRARRASPLRAGSRSRARRQAAACRRLRDRATPKAGRRSPARRRDEWRARGCARSP